MDLAAVARTAEDAHRGQSRAHGAPYIDHPRAVLRFVEALAAATGFALTDEVRAVALLHDVIEDSELTEAALRERFGEAVARRVQRLSKPDKRADVSKDERGRRYWEALREADDATRLVKVADRLHNLHELPLTRDEARQRRYLTKTAAEVLPFAEAASLPGLAAAVRDAVAVCARLSGVPSPLDDAPPALSGVYPIVDLTPDSEDDDALALVDAACRGGARVVQVRAKGVDDRRTLAVCESAADRARAAGVRLIVNDRADLARLSGAAGVHVGTGDVPAPRAREIVGDEAIVGTSTHTATQLGGAATAGGLSYLAFGPVFASPTKQGHAEVTGTDALRSAAASAALPLVAIGGITDEARMAEVARAGAAMGAVISAVARADDPAEATRRLGLAHAAAFERTGSGR